MESRTTNCDGSRKMPQQSIRNSINSNRKMMNSGRRMTYGSSNAFGSPKVKVSFAKRSS
jgi:hypothetical protein